MTPRVLPLQNICLVATSMRREGGRHSCITGTKLYGNLTIKNLTTDRCLESWSGSKQQEGPRSKIPKNLGIDDMRLDADMEADPGDLWALSARHQHSKINDKCASAVFGKFQTPRGVRAKIIQRSHKEARQQLRGACRDSRFDV